MERFSELSDGSINSSSLVTWIGIVDGVGNFSYWLCSFSLSGKKLHILSGGNSWLPFKLTDPPVYEPSEQYPLEHRDVCELSDAPFCDIGVFTGPDS